MKAAIYIRTNINEKAHISQVVHLSNLAHINRWQSEIFSEFINGLTSKRVKEELLSRLYKNEFDVVMVYKLSDWSVMLSELLKEINMMTSKGKRFFSYWENFEVQQVKYI